VFDDPNALAANFASFQRSRHAKLLVAVPGCVAYAVNEAYLQLESLRFPGVDDLLAETEGEFAEALGRAWRNLQPSHLQNALGCYCSKVSSILALRKADCVHEDHFRLFAGYGEELRFASGWEFNLQDRLSRPGRRVYDVLRVHSRLVGHRASGGGLLEVRFVPAPSLRLVAEGLPDQGPLSATVNLRAGGRTRELVALEGLALDREGLASYRILDAALHEAGQATSANARLILEAAEREIAQGADPVYPVTEIIAGLFENGPTAAELQRRLALVRARLWDAPVIASRIRRKLDLTLLAPAFGKEIARLPLETGAELANVTMSAHQLDAADIYKAA
jgi:hypothetical protein